MHQQPWACPVGDFLFRGVVVVTMHEQYGNESIHINRLDI